ncbi:hypothetical protein ID866_8296, partial [Astraeus odoratus]
EHSKLLLSREWLVKIDPKTSTPYLLKFHSSPVDLTCCILVTDTKNTWAEALSSKQFARRWRDCNRRISSPILDDEEEEAWRTRNLDLLTKAHTLGGVADLTFEVVESKYGDLAFEMDCDAFKWRWDTIFVGHKTSADILSTHLIMPLISVNHLAFTNPNGVGDLAEDDLEKAIDKIGRTARRTVDMHIKNALSRPRLATTLRRMTAVFNFISDLPKVLSEGPKRSGSPTAEIHVRRSQQFEASLGTHVLPKDVAFTQGSSNIEARTSRRQSPITAEVNMDSATESEDEAARVAPTKHSTAAQVVSAASNEDAEMRAQSPIISRTTSRPVPGEVRSRGVTRQPTLTDTDSSPIRPVKKAKAPSSSSEEDSEEERRKHLAQIKSGAAPKGGSRQPLRRGGRRF